MTSVTHKGTDLSSTNVTYTGNNETIKTIVDVLNGAIESGDTFCVSIQVARLKAMGCEFAPIESSVDKSVKAYAGHIKVDEHMVDDIPF